MADSRREKCRFVVTRAVCLLVRFKPLYRRRFIDSLWVVCTSSGHGAERRLWVGNGPASCTQFEIGDTVGSMPRFDSHAEATTYSCQQAAIGLEYYQQWDFGRNPMTNPE